MYTIIVVIREAGKKFLHYRVRPYREMNKNRGSILMALTDKTYPDNSNLAGCEIPPENADIFPNIGRRGLGDYY